MHGVEKIARLKALWVMQRIKSNAVLSLDEGGKTYYQLKGTQALMADGTIITEDEQDLVMRALATNNAINILEQKTSLVDTMGALGGAALIPSGYTLKINPDQFDAVWNRYKINIDDEEIPDGQPQEMTFFDPIKRQITYGDRVATIPNDGMAESFCKFMYGIPINKSVSWDIIHAAVWPNEEPDAKSRRTIYDLGRRLNVLVLNKLGIKKLFAWKHKSFMREK